MPKTVAVTSDHLDWLKANVDRVPLSAAAAQVGCCVDTLKRILVRNGIKDFDGAKYVPSREFQQKTWSRPCLDCGCTKKRPKNYYYCFGCRAKRGYTDE